MIFDAQALWSDAQVVAPPAVSGVNASTNAFDTLANRDLAPRGERMYVVLEVSVIVNKPTLQFNVVGADDINFTLGRVIEYASPTLTPQASLTTAPGTVSGTVNPGATGALLRAAIPSYPTAPKRFYRIEYGIGGGGGVAATGTITIAAGAGVITSTVNGNNQSVTWATSDTATAAALAAAINADPSVNRLVNATSAAGVVTVNALFNGPKGNDITLAVTGTGTSVSGSALTTGSFTGVQASQTFTSAAGGGVDTAVIAGIPVSVTWIGTDTATMSRLANAINSHPQLSQLVLATVAAGVLTVTALATGTGPNSITTVASSGTNFSAGGATLAAGAGAASTNASATVTAFIARDEQTSLLT